MDKCFCHLNGFQVKDAVARRRIENGGFVTCKELGMDPADKDGNNGLVLSNAINAGNKIMLDDDYTITGAPVELVKDLSLIGDPWLSFRPVVTIANQAGILFEITSSVKNIVIENVGFAGITGKEMVMHNDYEVENNGLHCDFIIVNNCEFENLQLYRQNGSRLYSGGGGSQVKQFMFTGNSVRNAGKTFCELGNNKFDSVDIRNNRVHNFKYTLFNFGTENLPASATDANRAAYDDLKAHKGKVLVDNNVVTNDFAWVQNEVGSLYYCFVLAETGGAFVYTNNHVEGMKASVNIATYDFYAGSPCVISEGNLWKNNICFAADHDNCTLMKAKGGGGRKTFRNNRYIIEPEYVERLINEYGAAPAGLWVDLLSCADDAEWDVSENMIDLAVRLQFFPATITASKVDIINNKFAAECFTKCFTARDTGTFWRFENNTLNATAETVAADYKTVTLTAACKTGGLTQIKNNEFILPLQVLTARNSGMMDSSFIVEGNRFVLDEIKFFYVANATNNEVSCKKAGTIVTATAMDGIPCRKIKMRLDTVEAASAQLPIYIELPESRAVHFILSLRHYANGTFKNGSVEVHTTADGSITITDNKTGETNYAGLINPESNNSADIFSNLLRRVLYAPGGQASAIRGGGDPGILDIDFEIYQ